MYFDCENNVAKPAEQYRDHMLYYLSSVQTRSIFWQYQKPFEMQIEYRSDQPYLTADQ